MSRRVIILVFVGFIALDAIVFGLYWFLRPHPPVQIEEAAVAVPEQMPATNHAAEGFAFKRQGQHAEAAAAFEMAIREPPDHSDAYHGLAQVQRDMNDPATAMRNHDRAIELDPGRHDLYWERGVTCQRLKDY